MTIRELINTAQSHSVLITALFILIPFFTWSLKYLHGWNGARKKQWRRVYTLLVYLACIPGSFSLVLTFYTLFFTSESLLDANLLVYAMPIASMIVTILLMQKAIDIYEVPGFGRLAGLMIMLFVSMGFALAVRKTRIFIFFGSGISSLLWLTLLAYGLLEFGCWLLFRKKNEPR